MGLTWWIVLFEMGLGGLAILVGALLGWNPVGSELITGESWTVVQQVTLGVVATVPPAAVLVVALRSRWRGFVRIRAVVSRVLGPLLVTLTAPRAGAVALAAGVGEEVLFRGLILAGLAPVTGAVPALFLSSLIFGGLHWVTFPYAVYATVFGIYLGMLYLATGALLAPITVHVLYDAGALLLLAHRARHHEGCHEGRRILF